MEPRGVTHVPEPPSPRNRSRVHNLSPTYWSHSVHHEPKPHSHSSGLSSLGTRATVWLRYLHDTDYAGLAGGVDPVGFASGVGERSVGFGRVVFDRVDSNQFPVL